MKRFYSKALAFWFLLLIIALVNAVVRETTYKPLLLPYIGMWAHQISSITVIVLFYFAITWFLKKSNYRYTRKDLLRVGMLWITLTIIFETSLSIFVRHLTSDQIIQTYYIWKGETWLLVLFSLIVSPQIIFRKPTIKTLLENYT
jgi:hypothetical protein